MRIFDFVDDNFGVNKQHISDLCNSFSHHCPDIRWSCIARKPGRRRNHIFNERSGMLFNPDRVESGNNEALSRMRKNITIEKALSTAKIIKIRD